MVTVRKKNLSDDEKVLTKIQYSLMEILQRTRAESNLEPTLKAFIVKSNLFSSIIRWRTSPTSMVKDDNISVMGVDLMVC